MSRTIIFISYLLIAIFCLVPRMKFDYGADNIPFPAKMESGGEDAHACNENLLAVADGDGGWNSQGINPALYSRELVEHVVSIFQASKEELTPKQILINAAKANLQKGSSTLVIGVLNSNGNFSASFIGDSGYAILRDTGNGPKIIHRSREQQHSFNYPFQVGHIGDDPSEAIEEEHNLMEGDVVVLGSDGLFDNLFDKDIEECLKTGFKLESSAELSKLLAKLAYKYSLDKKRECPFGLGAKKSGYSYEGGKSDDISVVVGRVIYDTLDSETQE